ncbi:flavin-dependent oxidoreductase [Rhodococcus qingshengii]|uniref:flavin-dependent oxidoreductase n=1 Tax=Rhodococcus qingshengii TaxID=334542 RepID=UPI0022B380C3|nr:flavin-dependent oxidoreductase [Rhodococcus qingshengii]MCZ4618623.1 flavin-dependent oxidoreductase [Rhodococcus qingshengii]
MTNTPHSSGSTTDLVNDPPTIAIVGAGIGGLVLALELHRAGFASHVYEAARTIQPLGVGINILPHAAAVLGRLGLEAALTEVAVTTKEAVFYNRFGQHIHSEPAGRQAGYEDPQYSIHRGDLQTVLLDAVAERLGPDAVVTDHKCVSVEQDETGATIHFQRGDQSGVDVRADIVIACDGVHSAIRKQFYPDEGAPRYSGVTMWRGVTVAKPYLTGGSMARIGWLEGGKMVIYPIRDNVDGNGNQLINWVAEIETPQRAGRDWTREGQLEDFIGAFDDWTFEWLDVPSLIRGAESVLEYPMADQEPLPRWTFGRVTLLGDAAHPMVPRGSNGAGQAILDASRLAELVSASNDPLEALSAYEADRLPRTSAVVLANRVAPPDTIVREVWKRTGDKPFDRIEDVISVSEIEAISRKYQEVAGYTLTELQTASSVDHP